MANLSAGGIGLVCPPGIPVPAAFTIRLYRRGEPSWSEYPVGMVYAHRLPGGALAVGGKFARDLPADELQGFL